MLQEWRGSNALQGAADAPRPPATSLWDTENTSRGGGDTGRGYPKTG